jgi:hypothetical protein
MPEARDHGAEPDRDRAQGSQRDQNRCDVERGGQDQPYRWYYLQGSDGLDAASTEVFDPFLTDRHGGQLLLRQGRISDAGEQVGSGRQPATAQ